MEDLIRAAREGDRPAFDRLFDLSFDRIYATAWALFGERKEAESITMQIFAEALRGVVPGDLMGENEVPDTTRQQE